MKVLFAIAIFLLLLSAGITVYLYNFIFYYPPKRHVDPHEVLSNKTYSGLEDRMLSAIAKMESLSFEEVSVISDDGYKLYGRYYNLYPDAPLEIFFHGYHGTSMWDGYGCFKICQKYHHNLLMVDERAHGKSEGSTITFGIKERFDCLKWVKYARECVGSDTDIILSGVSMGAATIMMAAPLLPPSSVKLIIADCGFTSPSAIIKKISGDMHIPAKISYPFVKLSALIWGHFYLEEASAQEAVKKIDIPVLFISGECDDCISSEMSSALYDACVSEKQKVTVPKAGHAVSAIVDFEAYEKAVSDMYKKVL